MLNVTLNEERQITNVFAGNLIEAHKKGCKFVERTAMQPVEKPFDVVVTTNSGYPLDLNLYQGVKGMSAGARIVKEGGTLIIEPSRFGAFGKSRRESSWQSFESSVFSDRPHTSLEEIWWDATTKTETRRYYIIDAESDEQLSIDVAVLGDDQDSAIVVSSGVHGVEGFLGSVIQLAWLDNLNERTSDRDVRCVLIHGVNPFGFSKLHRFNEDNVALNRNFLASKDDYVGAPVGYAGLDHFLNPKSAPSRFEPFKLKAIWNIWRMGLPALKEAVTGGQCEYPRGLFFGGKEECIRARMY